MASGINRESLVFDFVDVNEAHRFFLIVVRGERTVKSSRGCEVVR